MHGCRHPTPPPELLESPSMRRLIEASKLSFKRGLSMPMLKLAHSSSVLRQTGSKTRSMLWTGLSGSDINAVLPDKGEHLRQQRVRLPESCGRTAAAVQSKRRWHHMR